MVEIDESGLEVFRICEINARFCWNGFMHGGFGQDSLSEFHLKSRGLTHATDAEEVRLDLLYSLDSILK